MRNLTHAPSSSLASQSFTEYCVEYAKSNRAGCKVCKSKIEKDALRIGTSAPGPGDYMMTSWRHFECQKKPKALSDLSQLAGLASLSADDQAKVEAWFASPVSGKSTGKKRAADDADGTAGPDLASADLKKMKAGELKAALEAAGLSTTGKKAEHVVRLHEVAQRAMLEARYGAMKGDALKEELRLNGQKVSGTKEWAPITRPPTRARPPAPATG